jgi:hypothetical protein
MPTPNWLSPVVAPSPGGAPAAWYDPSQWGATLGNLGSGLSRNSNLLLGLGAGLLSGNLGAIPQDISQGAQADRQQNLQDYQLGLQAQQRNATAQWARDNGYGEYADAIEAGAISGSDIFNLINKQTVVPQNSYVINGKGDVTAGSPNPGSFPGQDLKSQAWNTVLRGQGDPAQRSTPQYAAAWAIVTQPTMTPQGMIQPNVPQAWAPISAGNALPSTPAGNVLPSAPAAAVAAPQGSDVAPIGSLASAPQGPFQTINPAPPPVRGPGIIPGTTPFNESQQRTNFLANSATPDLQRVIQGYPALMNTKDQLLQKLSSVDPTGLARAAQDPAYKQAKDAMSNDMVNLLYFASGANINKDEWARKVEAYLPAIGDDPQTAVNKLDRFANDVLTLANGTKDPDTIAWAKQALSGIQATEQSILNGGKKPVTGKTSNGISWSLN